MKLKSTVLVVLTTAIIICAAIIAPRVGKAASFSKDKCPKIAVVSVRKILQDCRRNAKYRQEMTAERDKMEADLEKLSREIDLGKTSLKALKPSSGDYANLMKELLEKQGQLQAQQEFFKRQMDMRQRGVMEQIYKDIIKAVAEVAKSKDFDLVLEKSEPDLPADTSDQLVIEISTNKVLYNSSCEDITDAVLVKVDAADKGS